MNKKSLVSVLLIIFLLFGVLIIYGCGQGAKETGITPGEPWIVFVSERDGQRELYKMKTDGSEQSRLTQSGSISALAVLTAEAWDPAISPDGTKIAYKTNKDDLINDTTEIYVSNLDGSNPIRLTNNSSPEHHPTWSPDGIWIAFGRYYPSPYDGQKIFKIKSDGTGGTTELAASGPGYFDYDPDWSHDGTMIAFASTRNSAIEKSEVFIMSPDGSSQQQLIGSLETWSARQPRWSPDGSNILYCVYGPFDGSNNNNLFVMNTSLPFTVTQLTTSEYPVDNWEADWSEDGTKIIFASDRDVDEVRQIYIMNANGTNPQRLTDTSNNHYPVWLKP